MTGLDPAADEIVEIAAIVTDAHLTELDTGVTLVVRPSDGSLERMDPFVVNMHTESGLITEIPNGISLADAEAAVLEYVKLHVPDERKAPLAGSSVYVDRGFLAHWMPSLDAHLHYRLVDVSTIKELAKRWYPRVYFNAPDKRGNHRALGDIRESIAELRYYRDAMFVEQPGPDTARAMSIPRRTASRRSLGVPTPPQQAEHQGCRFPTVRASAPVPGSAPIDRLAPSPVRRPARPQGHRERPAHRRQVKAAARFACWSRFERTRRRPRAGPRPAPHLVERGQAMTRHRHGSAHQDGRHRRAH